MATDPEGLEGWQPQFPTGTANQRSGKAWEEAAWARIGTLAELKEWRDEQLSAVIRKYGGGPLGPNAMRDAEMAAVESEFDSLRRNLENAYARLPATIAANIQPDYDSVPIPTTRWKETVEIAKAMARMGVEFAASNLFLVGEAMDAEVVANRNGRYSRFERAVSGASLGYSVFTCGAGPNFGPVSRGMRRMLDAVYGTAHIADNVNVPRVVSQFDNVPMHAPAHGNLNTVEVGGWYVNPCWWKVTDFPRVGTTPSQKQLRRIRGRREYRGGGYFDDVSEAQTVLDAFHSGNAAIIGKTSQGFPVVRFDGVTGTNVNISADFPNQPTNVFIIKGTASPSVVPVNPRWGG